MIEKDLSSQEREDILRMLFEKNRSSKCQVLTIALQFARVALRHSCSGGQVMVPTHFCNQKVDGALFALTEFVGGCGAGRFYMVIRANGDIDPCVFFPNYWKCADCG